jgi:hypothetical protein
MMNQILKQAISALCEEINTEEDLLGPSDECYSQELFIALHKRNVRLDSATIKSYALENGCSEKLANDIAKLGSKIGSGTRVKVNFPHHWGEPTVKDIMGS